MNQYPDPYGSPPPGYQADPYGRPDIGYRPPGYNPPPMMPTPRATRAPRRRRGGIIAFIVIVALAGGIIALVHGNLITLVRGGGVNANSATLTVKDYYNDLFSYNYDAAFALICADKQSAVRADFDATTQTLDIFKGYATFDTSKLTYSLKSGGTTAGVVTVSGNIILSGSALGLTASQPIPVSSSGDSTDVPVTASGSGWCIDVLPDSGTLPNN